MELIESKFQHAISAGQETKLLTETNATEFVTFIYPLIADINFKISVAALKMTTELLKRKHVRLL